MIFQLVQITYSEEFLVRGVPIDNKSLSLDFLGEFGGITNLVTVNLILQEHLWCIMYNFERLSPISSEVYRHLSELQSRFYDFPTNFANITQQSLTILSLHPK